MRVMTRPGQCQRRWRGTRLCLIGAGSMLSVIGLWGSSRATGFAGMRLMSCPAALHRRSPMLDLYFWPTGNGKKIIIQLEECELPYTIKPINIGRGDQLTPDFLKISPNGRMPAIVDHDPMGGGTPISIFESGAIMTYLCREDRTVLPIGPTQEIRCRPVGQLAVGQSRPQTRRARPFPAGTGGREQWRSFLCPPPLRQ